MMKSSIATMTTIVAGDTFRTPGLCPPQLEDLRALNQEMKYMCPDQQLKEMSGETSQLPACWLKLSGVDRQEGGQAV